MVTAEKFPHSKTTQLQPHTFNHLTTYIPTAHPFSISKSTMPPKSQDQADDKRQAAREVIDILQEISDLLVRAHPPRTVVDRIWIHLGLLFHIIHHYLTPLQDKKIKLYNIIPKTDMSNRIPTWTGQSCRFVCLSLKTGSTPMLWRYAFPHEIYSVLHASFGVKVPK